MPNLIIGACPLRPRKPTNSRHRGMSALCQKRTNASQQTTPTSKLPTHLRSRLAGVALAAVRITSDRCARCGRVCSPVHGCCSSICGHDPSHTQPPPAVLISAEFLVITGEGQDYSEQDADTWLRQTGWKKIEQTPLADPTSLIVAEAV